MCGWCEFVEPPKGDHVTPTTLTAAFLAPMAALAVAASDPPVRVRLSDNVYVSGDHARVNVKTAKDGYLLVLRVDTEGRVRVLFPVDPGSPATVKGGKNIEIRGRGDRDAFTVSENSGAGLVFAARSDTPFNFAQFMTGQHWNLDALAPVDSSPDPEAAMLKLVDRMGDGHYDYDAEPYTVAKGVAHRPMNPMLFYDPIYGYGPYRGYPGAFYSGYPWFYGPGFGMRTTVVIPLRHFGGRRR